MLRYGRREFRVRTRKGIEKIIEWECLFSSSISLRGLLVSVNGFIIGFTIKRKSSISLPKRKDKTLLLKNKK
jgi:hypothetical protein